MASGSAMLEGPRLARFIAWVEANGVPAIVPSLILFAVVIASGMLLEQHYQRDLLNRTSVMALSWLAVGPWLVFDAVRLSTSFLESYRPLFPDDLRWSRLLQSHLRGMSAGWMWFGVPWSVIVTTVVLKLRYQHVQTSLEKWWVVLSFGTLFLLAGIGFWGVRALVILVGKFAQSGVAYRPYHPDRFGGLAAVGAFAARGALYFSSGAVVLPLAFEVVGQSQRGEPSVVPALAYGATATFIVVVLAAFVLPVIDIKRFADGERVRLTTVTRSRLDSLAAAYAGKPDHDEQLARQISHCFDMEYSELSKLRPYPYDLKVGLELGISVAVPIGVVILERLLR
jgi:hypothetical protein